VPAIKITITKITIDISIKENALLESDFDIFEETKIMGRRILNI
jgi:hypothetical protein